MKDYLDRLENAILELGSEVYALKSEVRDMNEQKNKLQVTMKTLRDVLDDKGLLSQEDFELALTSSGLEDLTEAETDRLSMAKPGKENLPN